MSQTPAGLDFGANEVAPAAPAATVLVLRESGGAVEVFCVRRHTGIAFMGGAVVFPGGKLDPGDRNLPLPLATDLDPRGLALVEGGQARPDAFAELRALAVAACREALEEAAILPVAGPRLDADDVSSMRRELEAGKPLEALLIARSATLDLAALIPFARWVTPEAERRRFDARFFLLRLPEGQVGQHDDRETTQGFWDTPRGVLERFERGEIQLAPPTTRSLEVLLDVTTFEGAREIAGAQSLSPICPRFVPADPPVLALPGDPAHSIAEVRVAGPTRFVLRDGRFVGEDAPGERPGVTGHFPSA